MSIKQEDVHMNEILLRQHAINMSSEDSDDEGNIEFDTKRHRSNSYQESGDDRIEKSRERNREHAKKTRLRKKVMLENLKGRLLELQNESARLQQALDENNTANILLCLGNKADESGSEGNVGTDAEVSSNGATSTTSSNPSSSPPSSLPPTIKGNIIDQLRSIVRAEAAIYLKPKFEMSLSQHQLISSNTTSNNNNNTDTTTISSLSSSINPVSFDEDHDGHESDEDGDEVMDPTSSSMGTKNWKDGSLVSGKSASPEEIDVLRRERNRMHAKLTRDRKKMFTSRLQQLIHALECQNSSLRNRLQQIVKTSDMSLSSSNTLQQAYVSGPQSIPNTNLPTTVLLHPQYQQQQRVGSSINGSTFEGHYPHPINGMMMQSFTMHPGCGFAPAISMNMNPPININAYAPLALKRKASEAYQLYSTGPPIGLYQISNQPPPRSSRQMSNHQGLSSSE